MSLADAQSKVATLLTPVLGIVAVYPRPPQAAIPESELPAIFNRPQPFTVGYSASQRIIVWAWETVVLVARTENLPDDYTAIEPLIEPCIAAFEANTQLGTPTYYDAKATGGEIGPVTYGDAQYVALILQTSVKEKKAVSLS